MATDPPAFALPPAPPPGPRRGRGATFNPDNRFRDATRVAVDDGWAREPDPEIGEETSRQVRTIVAIQPARTIITRNRSPDIPFDASINPYQGCEHGCIYCYARPTHAYLDLSPGLDFETKLFAKPDAPKLLREELAKPGYVCDPIALGTNTDPYQPIERARSSVTCVSSGDSSFSSAVQPSSKASRKEVSKRPCTNERAPRR